MPAVLETGLRIHVCLYLKEKREKADFLLEQVLFGLEAEHSKS